MTCVLLFRLYAKNVLMSFNDIGKKSPTFGDATRVAQNILDSDYKFDNARMFYNVFK